MRSFLLATFEEIDTWFEQPEALRIYKPRHGGWSVNEILEHIGLTSHFLLILIEKGTNKALQNAQRLDLQEALQQYSFHRDQLTEVGLYQSFTWIRPEHMEPAGGKTQAEVRSRLKEQVTQCLDCLERLKHGEGVLYKTTMSVNNLGKIDVYEYIYFLAQHGARHIVQMQKVADEFNRI